MTQAIAGVTPSESKEVTVMETWPSVTRFALGRILGRAFAIQWGFYVFRVGNFIALAAIPVGLALYFLRLVPSFLGAPFHGVFYRLTNRRVLVLRNEVGFAENSLMLKFVFGAEVKSVDLDRFDSVEVERLPGHHWHDAGDLVFRLDGVETFRLEAVSRPESFRHTCMKSRASFVGVKQALERIPVSA